MLEVYLVSIIHLPASGPSDANLVGRRGCSGKPEYREGGRRRCHHWLCQDTKSLTRPCIEPWVLERVEQGGRNDCVIVCIVANYAGVSGVGQLSLEVE